MRIFASLPLILALLAGCNSQQTPSQIYDEYNSRVIDGISFPDEQAYFSQRKIDEVESKLPQYMERMGKSRQEVIEFYLKLSSEQAKSKAISLVSEVIDGNVARLEYSQKDNGGDQANTQEKHLIRMIEEDGWKIDDIEFKF